MHVQNSAEMLKAATVEGYDEELWDSMLEQEGRIPSRVIKQSRTKERSDFKKKNRSKQRGVFSGL